MQCSSKRSFCGTVLLFSDWKQRPALNKIMPPRKLINKIMKEEDARSLSIHRCNMFLTFREIHSQTQPKKTVNHIYAENSEGARKYKHIAKL